MRSTTQTLNALCCIAALALIAGCNVSIHRASTKITQTVGHRDASPIQIEASSGSIDLRADASATDVTIEATITCGGHTAEEAQDRLNRVALDVSRDTNGVLRISAIFPEPSRTNDGASFVVRLPNADGVTLTSSNGKLTTHGLSGELKLTTSNGAIEVADHEGDAELRTSNGRITIVRHSGVMEARTSNGRVVATDHQGALRATTSNGRIEVALAPDQPGPLDLRTSNGSITAEVGPAFAGEMSLRTRQGRLRVNDENDLLTRQVIDRRTGTLTFAEEGEQSTLQTSNGSITVKIAD